MYRVEHYKYSEASRVRLLSAIISIFLLPFLLSHLEAVDSIYIPFCQAQSQKTLSLAGAKEPAWREIGPWEQMVWISKMAPRRGSLITEDATMKLLRELATVGTALERRDFLRQELHNGLVQNLSKSNSELRRMAADVFVLGAIDALERREYIQAESFLQGSKLLLPGLQSQLVVESEIEKYWQARAENNTLTSWLQLGLYIVAGASLFYVFFGQSSSQKKGIVSDMSELSKNSDDLVQVTNYKDIAKERSREVSDFVDVKPKKKPKATEAEGLARTDVGYLTREIEVQHVPGDLDDIFSDPDAAVADMIGFDFAVGSRRNND